MATGQKPFAGANSVVTLEAVLTKKPIPPLKLNPKLPPDLEGIIGHAMEKNRANRYPDALTLKADLQALKRETDPSLSASGRMRSPFPYRIATSTFPDYEPLANLSSACGQRGAGNGAHAGGIVVVQASLGSCRRQEHHRRTPAAKCERRYQRGLPALRAGGRDRESSHLFAHPGRASVVLTQRYAAKDPDPQKVGRELHVATVLTGHFLKEGENLMVTLEAIDVHDNRLLWQTSFTAPEQDLIALQSNMAAQMRQGLLPTLGVTGGTVATGTRPRTPRPMISTSMPWRCLTIPDPIKTQ